MYYYITCSLYVYVLLSIYSTSAASVTQALRCRGLPAHSSSQRMGRGSARHGGRVLPDAWPALTSQRHASVRG